MPIDPFQLEGGTAVAEKPDPLHLEKPDPFHLDTTATTSSKPDPLKIETPAAAPPIAAPVRETPEQNAQRSAAIADDANRRIATKTAEYKQRGVEMDADERAMLTVDAQRSAGVDSRLYGDQTNPAHPVDGAPPQTFGEHALAKVEDVGARVVSDTAAMGASAAQQVGNTVTGPRADLSLDAPVSWGEWLASKTLGSGDPLKDRAETLRDDAANRAAQSPDNLAAADAAMRLRNAPPTTPLRDTIRDAIGPDESRLQPPANAAQRFLVDLPANVAQVGSEIALQRKVLPASLQGHGPVGEAAAWEAQNQASGGTPGAGAAMGATVGAIGKAFPAAPVKAAVAEGALFGGTTYLATGKIDEALVNALLPAAMRTPKMFTWLHGQLDGAKPEERQAKIDRAREVIAANQEVIEANRQLIAQNQAAIDRPRGGLGAAAARPAMNPPDPGYVAPVSEPGRGAPPNVPLAPSPEPARAPGSEVVSQIPASGGNVSTAPEPRQPGNTPLETGAQLPDSNAAASAAPYEKGRDVKPLLADARAGNEQAIAEATERGIAEFARKQPRSFKSKKKWTTGPEFRGQINNPDEIAANFSAIHSNLMSEGATLDNQSASGSRYYTMPDGSKVRVADHAPNAATQDWIDRNNVEEIRADKAQKKAPEAEGELRRAEPKTTGGLSNEGQSTSLSPESKSPAPTPVVRQGEGETGIERKGRSVLDKISEELSAPYINDSIRGEIQRRRAAVSGGLDEGRRIVPYRRSTYGSNQWAVVDVETGQPTAGLPQAFKSADMDKPTIINGPSGFKTKAAAAKAAAQVEDVLNKAGPAGGVVDHPELPGVKLTVPARTASEPTRRAPAPVTPSGGPGAASGRDATIERIVSAAADKPLDIVPKIELKGSDGKWYGPSGFPSGVNYTDETRVSGYVLQNKDGTTGGTIRPTEEIARQERDDRIARKSEQFRQQLRGMSEDELQRQTDYWLKEKTPSPAPTAPKKTATQPPPQRRPSRSPKKLLQAGQISDFEQGRDRVIREGNRTFVVDTRGERARTEVASDVVTPQNEANLRKLNPAQLDRMETEVRNTPYLSPEGKQERLDLIAKIRGASAPEPAPAPPLGGKGESTAAQPAAKFPRLLDFLSENDKASLAKAEKQLAKRGTKQQREAAHNQRDNILSRSVEDEDIAQRFKDALAARPWWELARDLSSRGEHDNGAESRLIKESLAERPQPSLDQIRQPQPGEVLPASYKPKKSEGSGGGSFAPRDAGPAKELAKRPLGQPAGITSERGLTTPELRQEGKNPPTHTTTINENAPKKFTDGTQKLKAFIQNVPEFALDPKFTVVGEKGEPERTDSSGVTTGGDDNRMLQFQDGGKYKFNPEALGVILSDEAKAGDTVGIDVDAVKKLKKGAALIVKERHGASPEISDSDLPARPPTNAPTPESDERVVSRAEMDALLKPMGEEAADKPPLGAFDKLEEWGKKKLDDLGPPGVRGGFPVDPIKDPQRLAAYVAIGIGKIGRGAQRFVTWSREMLKDFPDLGTGHLQQIWRHVRSVRAMDQDEQVAWFAGKHTVGGEQPVKTTIRQSTGLLKPDRAVSEAAALRGNLAAQARTGKAGWKAAVEEGSQNRQQLADLTQKSLPPDARGPMLKVIAKAQTLADLNRATQRLHAMLANQQARSAQNMQDRYLGKPVAEKTPQSPKLAKQVDDVTGVANKPVEPFAKNQVEPDQLRPDHRDAVKTLVESMREKGNETATGAARLSAFLQNETDEGRSNAFAPEDLERLSALEGKASGAISPADRVLLTNAVRHAAFLSDEWNASDQGSRAHRVIDTGKKVAAGVRERNPNSLDSSRGIGEKGAVRRAAGDLQRDMSRLATINGGPATEAALYTPLAEGESKAHLLKYQGFDAVDAVQKKHKVSDADLIRMGDKQERIPGVQLGDGRPLLMTPRERMHFAATWGDPDTRKLIEGGAPVILKRFAGRTGHNITVKPEVAKAILDSMTPFEKDYVAAGKDFINGDLAKAGNAASVKDVGFERLTSADYFPRSRDLRQTKSNIVAGQKGWTEAWLENLGFLKGRVNSKAPIVIDDYYNSYRRHVDMMSRYAHLSEPIRDILMLTAPGSNGVGIGQDLESHLGRQFLERVNRRMQDVSGMAGGDDTIGLAASRAIQAGLAVKALGGRLQSMLNHWMGGSLFFNDLTPGESGRFLAQAANPGNLVDLAYHRRMQAENGYLRNRAEQHGVNLETPAADTGFERLARSRLGLYARKLGDASMAGLRFGDARDVVALGKALEADYKANHPDATADEAFTAATKRAEYIVRRNGTTASPLDMSDLALRARRVPGLNLSLMFSSKLNKFHNVMDESINNFTQSPSVGTGTKLARAALITGLNAYLVSHVRSFFSSQAQGFPNLTTKQQQEKTHNQQIEALAELADVFTFGGGDIVRAMHERLTGRSAAQGNILTSTLDNLYGATAQTVKQIAAKDWPHAAVSVAKVIRQTPGLPLDAPIGYVLGALRQLGLAPKSKPFEKEPPPPQVQQMRDRRADEAAQRKAAGPTPAQVEDKKTRDVLEVGRANLTTEAQRMLEDMNRLNSRPERELNADEKRRKMRYTNQTKRTYDMLKSAEKQSPRNEARIKALGAELNGQAKGK